MNTPTVLALTAEARNALLVITLADYATPDEAQRAHSAARRIEGILRILDQITPSV